MTSGVILNFAPDDSLLQFPFQASNRYVRIYSNGDVFYSERIALDVSCPMKFHKLPFDTQVRFFLKYTSNIFRIKRLKMELRNKGQKPFSL